MNLRAEGDPHLLRSIVEQCAAQAAPSGALSDVREMAAIRPEQPVPVLEEVDGRELKVDRKRRGGVFTSMFDAGAVHGGRGVGDGERFHGFHQQLIRACPFVTSR